jgi:two-component system LytT family response regulator
MDAVIIDDEKYCTEVLGILLQKYCPGVQVTGIFNHAPAALEYLKTHSPDLIFLDIEMPHLNGFELLSQLGNIHSRVIFTTAYDQYALKAFRFNAIDYLLKPIEKDELIMAVGKSGPPIVKDQIENLTYLRSHQIPERILLPIGNEIIFVQVKDIICCEAEGSYCKVYCSGMDKPYLLSKNLGDIEDMLNNAKFFRPHTSWLVSENHINKIVRGDGMELHMAGNIQVPVARSKRQEVMERLK